MAPNLAVLIRDWFENVKFGSYLHFGNLDNKVPGSCWIDLQYHSMALGPTSTMLCQVHDEHVLLFDYAFQEDVETRKVMAADPQFFQILHAHFEKAYRRQLDLSAIFDRKVPLTERVSDPPCNAHVATPKDSVSSSISNTAKPRNAVLRTLGTVLRKLVGLGTPS